MEATLKRGYHAQRWICTDDSHPRDEWRIGMNTVRILFYCATGNTRGRNPDFDTAPCPGRDREPRGLLPALPSRRTDRRLPGAQPWRKPAAALCRRTRGRGSLCPLFGFHLPPGGSPRRDTPIHRAAPGHAEDLRPFLHEVLSILPRAWLRANCAWAEGLVSRCSHSILQIELPRGTLYWHY